MRQLSGRERILVFVGASAVVLFTYAFALLIPVRKSAAGAAQEAALLRGQIAQSHLIYRQAEAAVGEVRSLRQQAKELLFSAEDVRSGMVQGLEQLASEVGVTITSIKPGEPASVAGATKYPAVVKVEADLARIVRMLYELEQPTHRLWVEGVEITTGRQAGDRLMAVIYVAAYGQADESEESDVEA